MKPTSQLQSSYPRRNTDSSTVGKPVETPVEAAETFVGVSAARQVSRPQELLALIKYIGALFLATRLVLILIGVLSLMFIETGYGKQFSWSEHIWLDMWGVWDSFWYMDIAQNGYSDAGPVARYPDQTNFPFFPVYPLLMRLIGRALGGDEFLAGLLISNICLLLSAYLLYELVREDYSRETARRSVKYLFLYPVSFILSGVFTESTYLCLSLLGFYLAKRRRWLLVGLVGGVLSATRSLGLLIVLPLSFEYFKRIRFKLRSIRPDIAWVLLVPLGLLSFSAYNYQVTGDFFFYKTNQAAWGREIANPVVALVRDTWIGIVDGKIKALMEVGFCLSALSLLTLFFRRIGFSYWLLGAYSIGVPLAAGVKSMARFTLPVFPLFIILAELGQDKRWDRRLAIFLSVLQACLMVAWCTGRALVI